MKATKSVEDLQKESRDEKAKGNFARSIACIHEIIGQLGENTVDLKIAAQEWERMAGMYIRLERPWEAEAAVRNALDAYVRNRALHRGEWHRERDQNIAEYSRLWHEALLTRNAMRNFCPMPRNQKLFLG